MQFYNLVIKQGNSFQKAVPIATKLFILSFSYLQLVSEIWKKGSFGRSYHHSWKRSRHDIQRKASRERLTISRSRLCHLCFMWWPTGGRFRKLEREQLHIYGVIMCLNKPQPTWFQWTFLLMNATPNICHARSATCRKQSCFRLLLLQLPASSMQLGGKKAKANSLSCEWGCPLQCNGPVWRKMGFGECGPHPPKGCMLKPRLLLVHLHILITNKIDYYSFFIVNGSLQSKQYETGPRSKQGPLL